MHYVYFIFAGYRVAIGKTSNLYTRLISYQRTYLDVFILGIIPCESSKLALEKERECLHLFKDSKAFRDMFYLSPTMKDYITEHTEPYTSTTATATTEQRRIQMRAYSKEYRKRPEARQRNKERKSTPEYRQKRNQHQRERYRTDPSFRAKRLKESQRQSRKKQGNSSSKNQLKLFE